MMFAETSTLETPGFWIMMVPSIATLIFAIAGWINAQRAVIQATSAKDLGEQNKEKLIQVGKQFDGRLTQLLAETEKAQRALGVTEGQDKERGIQREDLVEVSKQARELVELAAVKATELLEGAAGHCRAPLPAVLAVPAVVTSDGSVEVASHAAVEPEGETIVRKARPS